MNKILSITMVLILILGGTGTFALKEGSENKNEGNQVTCLSQEIFSNILVDEKRSDSYLEVGLNDVSSYLMSPGKPMLPKVVKSYELPFGVKDVEVEVTPIIVQEFEIKKEVRPAPVHIPLTVDMDNGMFVNSKKDVKVYNSSKPFPSAWYKYKVVCGLNQDLNIVTHVITSFYPVRYIPAENMLHVADSADIKITYDLPESNPFAEIISYDMVIIAPSKFSSELQRLIKHKNFYGVNTVLKTTENIYSEYTGRDKPEQIKRFIKDAKETWNVKYVLLIGGLKSLLWGKPRDDPNQGTKSWHVPVRYNNFFDNPEHPLTGGSSIHDPGVISDLYYADIYKEGGEFEDWDPNGDGMFAAWGKPGVENDTGLDLYPDVCIGRLACRNKREVKNVINKIIRYEQGSCEASWFKKMIVISGDGFLDQEDLDIQWNTNGFPDGEYTICAQSKNPDEISGPVDTIHITLNKKVESKISFNHDDHLKIDRYPFLPIAEITSPSNGDILGNTDYFYEPKDREAYCNSFTGWANVSYEHGIMHIRGKSYDPQPYGNVTDLHVWIKNKDNEIVFSEWRNNTEMYYEGEWVTGEKLLKNGGGALYYIPEDFEKEIIWTSNGKLKSQKDVLEALNGGCGFAFFSGHGSPNVWADHYPGIPGNRAHGSVTGLKVIGLQSWSPFIDFPIFPMNKIPNKDKLPIVLIGGCHNSQFNVSMLPALLDKHNKKSLWTHGSPVPECFSWYLVKLPKKGAIATIGNTGLGYGVIGKDCTTGGLDGGICIEFFKQYGVNNHSILGEAYTHTLTTYVKQFDMENLDHAKSLTQWVLLGDPSLMIGGYK